VRGAFFGAAPSGRATSRLRARTKSLRFTSWRSPSASCGLTPKEDVTPARGWALDIIEKNSGVPFSQQDREALLRKPLSAKVALLGYGGIEGVDGFPGLLGAMMKKEGFPVMKLPELNQSITLSQTSGRKPRSDPEAQIVRHRKASGLKHHRS